MIRQNKLSKEIQKKIFDGFERKAISATGINGLAEEAISFEMFNNSEFMGAIVVRIFWGELHIKYLFVEEEYQSQGIGRKLMRHALEFGKNQGCRFAFVETMSFQSPEFYQKMGFEIEFSRPGYAANTVFHYLKKSLDSSIAPRPFTRTGVYGVAKNENMMLLIRQKRGPYAGKFDFPGGGIEFGESPEEALRREFIEEVAMEFDTFKLLDNFTATIDMSKSSSKDPYVFYQIGMIYQVFGCRLQENQNEGDFQPIWMDPMALSEDQCSKLLWKYRMTLS